LASNSTDDSAGRRFAEIRRGRLSFLRNKFPCLILPPLSLFEELAAPSRFARPHRVHALHWAGPGTVGLLGAGCARLASSREQGAAIRRMKRHGAEMETMKMVVFEWLQTTENPSIGDAVALIK
jgi:hypothetical protein